MKKCLYCGKAVNFGKQDWCSKEHKRLHFEIRKNIADTKRLSRSTYFRRRAIVRDNSTKRAFELIKELGL